MEYRGNSKAMELGEHNERIMALMSDRETEMETESNSAFVTLGESEGQMGLLDKSARLEDPGHGGSLGKVPHQAWYVPLC